SALVLWLPALVLRQHGARLPVGAAAYPTLALVLGSVVGGWSSGFLMKRGLSGGSARLAVMAAAAGGASTAALGAVTDDSTGMLGLLWVAAACHGAWSPNMYSLASDLFPPRVVGTVVAMGGLAAALGGMFVGIAAGLLQTRHLEEPPLIAAG